MLMMIYFPRLARVILVLTYAYLKRALNSQERTGYTVLLLEESGAAPRTVAAAQLKGVKPQNPQYAT